MNLDDMMRKGYRIYALRDFKDLLSWEIKERMEEFDDLIVHVDEDRGLLFVIDKHES